jgi:ankyrin repeat protein
MTMMLTKLLARARLWLPASLCLVAGGTVLADEPAVDQSIIVAVREQDHAAIAERLANEVDVNARQADGATALHWAVHRDDAQTTKRLIELRASVDVRNDFGITPLSLACTNGNAPIIEALLIAGADPNAALLTGETPLMTAAHSGNLDAVGVLLKHGANVNAKEPVRQQTALMWALGEKHTEVARKLIEHGADIRATTTLGFTPLLFAVREGDLEATRTLLEAGADPNTTAKDDLSALHVATLRGHAKVAALLLDRGADPNADGPGYTPLHWAAGTWETELNGANGIKAPADHEWNRMRGVQEGKLELVKALLDRGADPNARLKKNPPRYGFTVAPLTSQPIDSTPLTLAAFAGETKIMRLLVEHGADPSLRPKNGLTPLLIAAGVNRVRAELTVPEDKLLAAVEMAVELGADVNETDPAGNTAVHGAAWIRSTKIIRFLSSQGADVNAVNKRGQSPLYIAQRDGRFPGEGPKLEQSEVADLLRELRVP